MRNLYWLTEAPVGSGDDNIIANIMLVLFEAGTMRAEVGRFLDVMPDVSGWHTNEFLSRK